MKKVLEKKLQPNCQSSRNLDISDVVHFIWLTNTGLTNGIHLGIQAYSSIWRRRKNAAFHISDTLVEAISEKSYKKKVTAKLPEQQKL